VPIAIDGIADAAQLCLVDTGALHNRFAGWIAAAAGLELAGAPEARFAVGGLVTTGRMARVDLSLDDHRFDAPVWFCEPWPFGFNLLGQEGFLRYFRVTLCAAESWLACEPEPAS
jgi:hypothetical protein